MNFQKSEANLTQLAIEQKKPNDSNANVNINTNNNNLDDPSKSSIRSKKSGNILTQFISRSRRKKLENYSETKVQLVNYKMTGEEDEEIGQAKHSSLTSLAAAVPIPDSEKPQKIKSKSRIPVPKQSHDAAREKTQVKQDNARHSEGQISNKQLRVENKASVQSTISGQSANNANKVSG